MNVAGEDVEYRCVRKPLHRSFHDHHLLSDVFPGRKTIIPRTINTAANIDRFKPIRTGIDQLGLDYWLMERLVCAHANQPIGIGLFNRDSNAGDISTPRSTGCLS